MPAIKSNRQLRAALLVLTVLVIACSKEQLNRSVYNTVHPDLCFHNEAEREAAFPGGEACSEKYDKYKNDREKALNPTRKPAGALTKTPEINLVENIPLPGSINEIGARADSNDDLSGCWLATTDIVEGVLNTIKLCLFNYSATMRIYYPNTGRGKPTECSQKGEMHRLESGEYFLVFNQGACKNGRVLSRTDYECRRDSDVLNCSDLINEDRYTFRLRE